jgi:integrase
MNFSLQQRRINVNPCLGYQKLSERSDGMLFWSEEEVNQFLTFAHHKYHVHSPDRWIFCAYLLALETGMRAREIWGLRLSDLPKVQRKLKVSWQISRFKTFEPTKGKDSRYVPFSEHLNDELVPLLKGAPLSSRTLFTSEKGTPVDHDNFVKRVFKKDCMEAKVTTIRFHDLRHTALTMMVKKGVLLPVIQKIAGHKKIKTTMRYVHVVAKDIEEVGQKFSLMSSFSNKENGRLKLV